MTCNKYLSKLQAANDLFTVSPDLIDIKSLFHSLLSLYSKEHKIYAYLTDRTWRIVPQPGTFDPKPDDAYYVGKISAITLVAFYEYLKYTFSNDMHVQLIKDSLTTSLYAALTAYSAETTARRLQSLTAIHENINKNSLVLWFIELFKDNPELQDYRPIYQQLCTYILNIDSSDCVEDYYTYEGTETVLIDGNTLTCEKYCTSNILFLAYKDFELASVQNQVRGYRVCSNCGSLFVIHHKNQKLCSLCGGRQRHCYTLLRRQLSNMSESVITQFAGYATIRFLLGYKDFYTDITKLQNYIKTAILYNTIIPPPVFKRLSHIISQNNMWIEIAASYLN